MSDIRDTTGNILRPGMYGYEEQLAKQRPQEQYPLVEYACGCSHRASFVKAGAYFDHDCARCRTQLWSRSAQ